MKSLILISFIFAFVACTNHQLIPLSPAEDLVVGYGSVDAHICTSAPSVAQQNLKYLFILDHSGSNQPGFPTSSGDVVNTDPQGSRRYGPLVNFIDGLQPITGTTTAFNLIDFNDTAYQPGTLTSFDPSASDFATQVTADWTAGTGGVPIDQGFTNYQAALQMALQTIKTDAENEAASPNQPVVASTYVIVFVSDGAPTISNGSGGTYTQTYTTDIGPVISQIMALKQDPTLGPLISSITLNTAYYDNGTAVPGATALLSQMAVAGNGQYIHFSSGQNVLYQQFAPPERMLLNVLADVFVQNTNAVWTSDGHFVADSDGDGLPDYLELQLGSNPYKVDSDGNGVSDFVEYQTKGKPCNDAQCLSSARDQYAICSGYSPTTDANGNVTFSSTSNDGLNDCEKYVLGANPQLFNTNGDLIPDFFALTSLLPIIAGSEGTAFADPFGDGIDNYSKLKLGLPVSISKNSIFGIQQRTTSMVEEASSDPSISCYHLTVGNIALASYNDTMKLMVVQNSASFQDKPYLLSATAHMNGSRVATFSTSDLH